MDRVSGDDCSNPDSPMLGDTRLFAKRETLQQDVRNMTVERRG